MKKTFIIMAIVALFLSACNDYGTKKTFGKGELYYTEKVTETEADSVGVFLEEMGYLGDDKETSIQVDRVGETYKIRLVVQEQYQEKDSSLDISFKALAFMASHQVFDGKTVEIDLCDATLETKRTIK